MGLHAISACHLLPSTQLCGGGEPPNGSYPKRFLLAELFGSLLPVLLILFPEAAGWMKLLSTHWFWTVIAALWWWGRGCRAEEGDCSCGSDADHGHKEVE